MIEVGNIISNLLANESVLITQIRRLGSRYSLSYVGVNSQKDSTLNKATLGLRSQLTIKDIEIVHDIEKDCFLIGYIKEVGNNILYTNKDNQEFSITFDDYLM